MRFAPQRRAIFSTSVLPKEVRDRHGFSVLTWKCPSLFPHSNFQTWSEDGVFCTFWLVNAFWATAACHFSTSQLPTVFRDCFLFDILTCRGGSRHSGVPFFHIATSKGGPHGVFLYILTSKRTSRHSGLQFFISHPGRWLRTRRFREPTFRPSRPTDLWKHATFATFLTFRAPVSSLF